MIRGFGRRWGGSCDDKNSLPVPSSSPCTTFSGAGAPAPPSRTLSPARPPQAASHLFDGMAERLKARRTKKKGAAAAAAVGRDRFEDLPVHVLELLLSFLPSQDAVRTCVLAKRWRHIWKSVTSLRIYDMETEDLDYFVKMLIESRDPTVPLHACEIAPYVDGGKFEVDSWLRYAVSYPVQVIRVEIQPGYGEHHELYNNSVISEHLTRLVLYKVRFKLKQSVELWRCEALEVLDLEDCFINLGDISFAKSLRHLRINDSYLYSRKIRTRISAPGLVTCELSDCAGLTPLFGSLPSVTTAFIRIISESEDYCMSSSRYCEGLCCKNDCSVLYQGLSGATNLELIDGDSSMILGKDLRWRPTFDKLKTVLLNDWCVSDDFTGLIYFLHHSPILERLTLQLSHLLKSSGKMLESYTPSEHLYVSKHLKVVEIKFYKLEKFQIRQIVKLLGTLGVTREKIITDKDFSASHWFSFEQEKYK